MIPLFMLGAVTSLGMSWLLVSRLERLAERFGLPEVVLGMCAALAADAPEITSAIAAMSQHRTQVGAGVILGSNVFNLAALLGLGAIVAGHLRLHRRVVLLTGIVAMSVATTCLAAVLGVLSPIAAVGLTVAAVSLYTLALSVGPRRLARLPLPLRLIEWLCTAITEEEMELTPRVQPRRGGVIDACVVGVALLAVVVASVVMEWAATALGVQYAVPDIVVGGLALAVVTSLPNAVAAVYLAARGRGPAALSTAMNSNALNVTIGLLVPGAVLGLGRPSALTTVITAWYVGLTAFTLLFAHRGHGLQRTDGALIIAAYVVFCGSVVAASYTSSDDVLIAVAPLAGVGVALMARLAQRPVRRASRLSSPTARSPRVPRQSLVPGWSVDQLFQLGVGLCATVAVTDALLGARVILIGLLIAGPCCVLLSGRWLPTAVAGSIASSLAVVLGIPDGIWGSSAHLAFLGAVVVVALANTAAAAAIQSRG